MGMVIPQVNRMRQVVGERMGYGEVRIHERSCAFLPGAWRLKAVRNVKRPEAFATIVENFSVIVELVPRSSAGGTLRSLGRNVSIVKRGCSAHPGAGRPSVRHKAVEPW